MVGAEPCSGRPRLLPSPALDHLAALSGLFASAFLAATVMPGASEIVLVAILVEGAADPVAAVLVAGIANTLGSITNWALGRFFLRYQDRRWFPVPKSGLDKAASLFNRWGVWSLLLAWWPLGGDALTVVAGLLKVPLLTFTLLVGFGKLVRYALVALATLGFLG
ncbi:MAG: DedA family protein [Fulvimarina manganoxydans]|nr:DedA family protein [Fulvimarina manganoxydans]